MVSDNASSEVTYKAVRTSKYCPEENGRVMTLIRVILRLSKTHTSPISPSALGHGDSQYDRGSLASL
jgi:hypothetical protein